MVFRLDVELRIMFVGLLKLGIPLYREESEANGGPAVGER